MTHPPARQYPPMGASDEGAARLWQPRTGRVRVLLRILNQRLRRLALLFSVVFAAVDGLTSAENIGLLTRNCAAFGAQALIVGETCISPYLRRAVRNSMGAIFKLPIVELKTGGRPPAPTLAGTLGQLRAAGVRCLAAHPHTNMKTVSQADFTGDCCIVFGSEGSGLSPAVLAACDEAVAVPMANDVDSLNVGAAAAVFLYEAARQRMSGFTKK